MSFKNQQMYRTGAKEKVTVQFSKAVERSWLLTYEGTAQKYFKKEVTIDNAEKQWIKFLRNTMPPRTIYFVKIIFSVDVFVMV